MDARSPDPNEQEFGGGEPERKDRGQGGRRAEGRRGHFFPLRQCPPIQDDLQVTHAIGTCEVIETNTRDNKT